MSSKITDRVQEEIEEGMREERGRLIEQLWSDADDDISTEILCVLRDLKPELFKRVMDSVAELVNEGSCSVLYIKEEWDKEFYRRLDNRVNLG